MQTSSPPKGLVLDPFCGTGRVLQVSLALGRRAIGFEKSGKFYRVARSKIGACGKETR
ncbi:MAG: DNA methyltransferase [Burkholderiales bacterium]